MIKFFMLIFLTWLTVSCSSDATTDNVNSNEAKLNKPTIENSDSTKLSEAITRAKQNNDYRLLVTSGRSINVPGIKASEYQTVLELCGKKYSSAAGDVITSEEQREERKKLVDFMRQYNEQMLVICQEKSIQ